MAGYKAHGRLFQAFGDFAKPYTPKRSQAISAQLAQA
jgi:hypothetical protein